MTALDYVSQAKQAMTDLERRLDSLLRDRKGKGRFRQLREYDENTLIDFVRTLFPADPGADWSTPRSHADSMAVVQ